MNYVHYMYDNVKYFYNSMNSATLSGAIDVIVVEQPDGTLLSTPFHVRFGKYGVFNYEDKYVDIEINNEGIDLKMKLDENGVARLDNGQSEASTATDFNLMSDSDDETSLVTAITISAGGTGTGRRVTLEKAVKYKRSLRLTSDQLKLLKLDYGSNDARFSITTKLQGTAWCCCHIYLLRWSDKLVISDVDGTITKSDVLGHVIPAIGGTWAHSGVAELYTRIKNNGYQMVYLSSRAIGQSHYTKTYLQSIAQGSKTLPDGPVLLSPTSVLMAFRKEVIERKPEEFKIACLADLKSLFPEERRPFFAGFGNRETDVKSYRAVGIPLERILIIDPAGMLRRADKIGYISDYATMAMDTVDYIFPPIPPGPADPDVQMEFGEFNTWRPKFQDHLVDEELEAYEARRKQRREADETAASEERKKKGASVVRRKGNKWRDVKFDVTHLKRA